MLRRNRRKSRWQQLIERGEQYSRREVLILYGFILILCVLLGLSFQLRPVYMGVMLVLCLMQVPRLYYNNRKARCEEKRFEEVNGYISQMTQAFSASGKILQALRDTRETFPRGYMRQQISEAIRRIESSCDVELSQQEALKALEEQYNCERIRNLHDFLQKAELRGGCCQKEFKLLESIRQIWEKSQLRYRSNLHMVRILISFEYILLVAICAFLLHQFPEDLQIIQLPFIQAMHVFLIAMFFPVFRRMDRRLCKSMLDQRERLGKKQAEKIMRGFRESKNPILRQYYYRRIKKEVALAFPSWLFDVLLLVQQESVPVALGKTVKQAPAILQEPIRKMVEKLEEEPGSAEAYLSFLAEYNIPHTSGIMRRLYALSNGNGVRDEVMELVVETNMNLLAEQEESRLRLKGDLFSVSYLLPTVPVIFCMAAYGVALMFTIFQNIMTII